MSLQYRIIYKIIGISYSSLNFTINIILYKRIFCQIEIYYLVDKVSKIILEIILLIKNKSVNSNGIIKLVG